MKVLLLVMVLSLATVALAKKQFSYKNYKVYGVDIKNKKQAALLAQFEDDPNCDFWSHLVTNGTVSVMVAPTAQEGFRRFLHRHNIKNSIKIKNVEKIVRKERLLQKAAPRTTRGRISFTKYHRYSEILDYVRGLESFHRNIVKVETIGRSTEGRDLVVIKISSGGGGGTKKTIYIDGGIHAREWISPAQVLYIIHQLVESVKHGNLIKNIDWHIVPVVNPDGYEYSHTNLRLWRKTRSIGDGVCRGTDGNRNYGFHWGETGASSSVCSETYRGKSPFSEPETRAIRDFILRNPSIYKLFLTFHSFGRYIIHPWGYTQQGPSDGEALTSLGERVNSAIQSVGGSSSRYKVGSSSRILYPTSGGSDDWAKGVANITNAFTLELPPSTGGFSGFLLPPNKILSVFTETFEGVKAFHHHIETL